MLSTIHHLQPCNTNALLCAPRSSGSGLLVLLAGWCIHCVAKHLAAQAAANKIAPGATTAARKAGRLSERSFSFLVAHEPVPFVLLDMREDKSSKLKHKSVRIRDAVQLSEALVDATKWRSITKGTEPFPSQGHLLIFVHDRKASSHAAVSAAFNCNFMHCFMIPSQKLHSVPTIDDLPEPQYMSTHAVAHMISLKCVSCDLKAPILVDVRRHDERALFGCIQGSVHVPVEQLALAVQEAPATFEEVAGTSAWSKDDLLIFHSRESLRACWAAQIMVEQGFDNVFVCKGGSNDWRFNAHVKSYPRYELGQPVPAGQPQAVEPVDTDMGASELRSIGLL